MDTQWVGFRVKDRFLGLFPVMPGIVMDPSAAYDGHIFTLYNYKCSHPHLSIEYTYFLGTKIYHVLQTYPEKVRLWLNGMEYKFQGEERYRQLANGNYKLQAYLDKLDNGSIRIAEKMPDTEFTDKELWEHIMMRKDVGVSIQTCFPADGNVLSGRQFFFWRSND